MFRKKILTFLLALFALCMSVISHLPFSFADESQYYNVEGGEETVTFKVYRQVALTKNQSFTFPSVIVGQNSGIVSLIGDGGTTLNVGGNGPAFQSGQSPVAAKYTLSGLSKGKVIQLRSHITGNNDATKQASEFFSAINLSKWIAHETYTTSSAFALSSSKNIYGYNGWFINSSTGSKIPASIYVCSAKISSLNDAIPDYSADQLEITYRSSINVPCSASLYVKATANNVSYNFMVNIMAYLKSDVDVGTYSLNYKIAVIS